MLWFKRLFVLIVRSLRVGYRAAKRLRSRLAPILHWNYSGVFGSSLLITGLGAVMTSNAYTFARLCLIGGGIWLIGWWLVSDPVLSKRPSDNSGDRQRWNSYRMREWIPAAVMACVLITLVRFTNSSEREYQRKDVYEHLDVTYAIPLGYGNDPMKSIVSVVNKGSFDISPRHRIVCLANYGITSDKTVVQNVAIAKALGRPGWLVWPTIPILPKEIPDQPPLLKDGDGETDSCLAAFHFTGEVECLDVTIVFQYALTCQVETDQAKAIRIVTYRTNGIDYQWRNQPLKQPTSYCRSNPTN